MLLRSDTIPRPASRGSAEAAGAKKPGVAGVDIPTPQGSHAAGVPILPSHAEILLNPQPLPPRGQAAVGQNPLLSGEIKLPGMVSIVAVPGFEETPIALAMMSDGAKLILGVNEDGRLRVAGTFAGPVGAIETDGS